MCMALVGSCWLFLFFPEFMLTLRLQLYPMSNTVLLSTSLGYAFPVAPAGHST